ncbi:hypothetical protein [Aeromonas phage 25AhydR2PP]|uniref:Uncharacterized protein n=1 Tax=Aeromonas phage 25AhydR2PP TaxID=2163976 RepID=A0A2S1PFN2_9CAUD|nr:hypothetical protein HOT20_gp41 [Aeromonas phage 25AhydR2PP]AWH15383.1 hypothetical protein [Aeromonas phage 25AhydR2PP]
MKKKFNPSAALGYKRIKPLYDKAVADLVIETARADDNYTALCDVTVERDSLAGIVERQKEKLKAAGHMVGHLIRERDVAIELAEQHKMVLVAEQKTAIARHEGIHLQLVAAMGDVRSLRGTQSTLDKQLDTLRHVVATQKCARAKAEREKMAALADVQKLKAKVRNWAIIAGTGVGFAVAACAKALMMGVV